MKIGWDGFTRLFRDLRQNTGEISAKSGHNKPIPRSFDPFSPGEEHLVYEAKLLITGIKVTPLPLLFRYKKSSGTKKDKQNNDSTWSEEHSTGKDTLDFVIETEELGVVVIKIEKEDGVYTGRLLVETGEAGKILEKGIVELQDVMAKVLQEKKINLQMGCWEIIPGLDLTEIKEDLHQFSYILDRKV